jgi:hypothetical protein
MGPVVKCPTCHRDLEWESAPFRPFCSERCRLIDLGKWASGQYVVSSPGDDTDKIDSTGLPGESDED